jgi:FkbM family methyltransferase
MKALRRIGSVIRLVNHPLNRRKRFSALVRWLSWKVAAPFLPGAAVFRFVDDSLLMVEPGLDAATCNLYTGLYEFPEMSFLLHVLRPNDVFVDVGANIGSYTVLAASVRGARSIAIEPVPTTFRHLLRNVGLNAIHDRVSLHNIGVGSTARRLKFTSARDCVNHVVADDEATASDIIEVDVRTLDDVVGEAMPVLIKIDVEGYEAEVIDGAASTLAKDSLLAVIMEINGSLLRYRRDERELHESMLRYGFSACTYAPFERMLEPLTGRNVGGDNTLYVRDVERVIERVRSSPRFRVMGYEL